MASSLHLEFIQDQAALAHGDGAEMVEAYHRALFLYHHAPQLEHWEQQVQAHEERLRGLETQRVRIQSDAEGLPRLLADPLAAANSAPVTTPWNAWDLTMFIFAGLGVIGLLVFGIFNISFNLLESGLITFQENPWRAYLWTALLPVGAFAVKLGWDFLSNPRRRSVYLGLCFFVGLAGVLIWVAAYAAIYPSLSKSTAERIQALSVFDAPANSGGLLLGTNAAGTRWIDAILVGSQAMAEIFLSAVLGIYMTLVFQRHHASRSSANPRFNQFDEQRFAVEQQIGRERSGLAEARGQRSRLEHQLTAVLAYARSAYEREVLLRRDQSHQQRMLLDQITEQLREQLETLTPVRVAGGDAREQQRPIGKLGPANS